ncbi:hypothetical protein GCM10010121_086590 [Streptomyces brasiliensis]|uniref:Uncharacterized protein n=1 Tax=Streptomyces brasiliensis TaxID=1954 RepID=A0A917P5F1_9ACTN|nr:hypothetical protein GCM10010121_086590 [Streptomyces brasiliensis]
MTDHDTVPRTPADSRPGAVGVVRPAWKEQTRDRMDRMDRRPTLIVVAVAVAAVLLPWPWPCWCGWYAPGATCAGPVCPPARAGCSGTRWPNCCCPPTCCRSPLYLDDIGVPLIALCGVRAAAPAAGR